MPDHSQATRLLRRRLGSRVAVSDDARFRASFDGSKLSFLPDAVVRPRSREEVAVVLRLANRRGVPVTVRGAGTSLTGSGSPVRGGWVLDLSGWRRLRVDAEAGMARVQAGVVVDDLHRAAEAAGWFYPPDPASKKYCTIGGSIACNAGGMHGGRYGVTRDFVLALEGFLPTGEFVRWGTPTRKYAAGFNLRDLWIGSEGMLGVVTEATVRLIPRPAVRWTLLTSFPDEESALRAARRLFAARVQPAICEFLDRFSVACAERVSGRPVFPGSAGCPLILLELAGSEGEVADARRDVLAWAKESAAGWREAADRAEAEVLWAVRRTCSGAMFELGDSKLNEDIVVPLAAYERFARFLERLRRRSRLPIPTFGHLADGNLHVNIMYHAADRSEYQRAERTVVELMRGVVALGGAISGEHGVGLAKSPFLGFQHGPAEIRAMQAIKRALDPQGILNPGKMFTPFKVWEHPRLRLRLPWDHK